LIIIIIDGAAEESHEGLKGVRERQSRDADIA
jgi:hypothetical protein